MIAREGHLPERVFILQSSIRIMNELLLRKDAEIARLKSGELREIMREEFVASLYERAHENERKK